MTGVGRGEMLRLVSALFPWLLVQGCTGLVVAASRSTHELQGDGMPLLGLWDPVFFAALAFLILGVFLAVSFGAISWSSQATAEDPAKPSLALLRTYRAVLPWVLAAAALTFFIASYLAHQEAGRTYWRVYSENFEDSVPADLDQAGPFEGSWVELSKLSYRLYLAYLVCFFAWFGVRISLARRILRNPRVDFRDDPPSLI